MEFKGNEMKFKTKKGILSIANLTDSSNLAREYFVEKGLRIESIHLKQCEKLSEFIQTEIDKLSKDKTYQMIEDLKMNPKIKVETTGIYLFVDGAYFKKRQAISFEYDKRDNYKFIGFCGWASGCNRIPFIRGFIEWCDYVSLNLEKELNMNYFLIKPPKCCTKPMELKSTHETNYTKLVNNTIYHYQCKKCGNVKKIVE